MLFSVFRASIMDFKCLALFFLFSASVVQPQQSEPVLQTPQGNIRGKLMTTRYNKQFAAFLGIPYAQPPTGDRRLRLPQQAQNWQGERDGTHDPQPCVQCLERSNGTNIIGNEDCLYVNVYTPKTARSGDETSCPVMVYIHGSPLTVGETGSEALGPHYLMDKDIVLVTVNYRLHRLGFLSMEDKQLPGNLGLKDQVAALKWIQNNIKSYGGDPNRVTLVGQGAGAISVALHLISPLSKGLFHRVISQSGSPLNYYALKHQGVKREETQDFANRVGCKKDSTEEMIKCMQNLPVEKFFIKGKQKLEKDMVEDKIPYNMGVTREPEGTDNAFLTTNPYDEIVKPTKIPLILGLNSAEGGVIANPAYSSDIDKIKQLDQDPNSCFPRILGYQFTVDSDDDKNSITKQIKDHYFQGKSLQQCFKQFVDMITDRGFVQPIMNTARFYKGPKYLYYYDHINQHRMEEKYGTRKVDFGASHGDELISLFRFPQWFPDGVQGVDKVVSDQLIEYWTNFVINGVPVNQGTKLTRWDPVKSDNLEYLYINGGKLEMRSQLRKDVCDLLNGFPIKHDF